MTWRDAVVIGLVQCFALIPGVSRSGATISAGLFRGMDRVSATRISFLLGIPALIAASGWEAVTQASHISATVGWLPVAVGIVVSFIVGYAAIAWLLKFVSHNTFTVFIAYRVALVAAGKFDAGLTMAALHDWDLAAADLVICEAGGLLTSIEGAAPRYNRADVVQPSALAAGPKLHAVLRSRLDNASKL